MARRYKHSLQEIKNLILQVAETIVEEEGYSALNARKIALNIGYTVGSLYMVFENMADIVLHINAKTLDNLVDYLQQAPAASSDNVIEALAKRYCQYASQHNNRWRMLFEYRPPKELPDWYQQHLETSFAKIAALLQTAPLKYQVGDKTLVIKTLWGSIHGIYVLSEANHLGAVDFDDLATSMALLIRNFLLDKSVY